MMVGMVLFWVAVIALVVWLVLRAARVGHDETTATTSRSHDPDQVLDERFARGEIDEQELRRRREALHRLPPESQGAP